MADLYYWVANWGLSRAEAAARLGSDAVDMVDCTHSALPRVRGTSIRRFGGYVSGSPDIQWTAQDFASLPNGSAVVSIDQSSNPQPLTAVVHVVEDVESGAESIASAVKIAGERIWAGRDDTVYVEQSLLAAFEQAVAAAGLPKGKVVGYQYASPTTNAGTNLPGTFLTLGEANADLSVVLATWLPLPEPAAPRVRQWSAEIQVSVPEGSTGVLRFHGELVLKDGAWTIGGLPGVVHWSGPGGGGWRVKGLPFDAPPFGKA